MGITDGSVICARCGEWRTTCPLCFGEEKLVHRGRELEQAAQREREADREMRMQEWAIRRAADSRQGFEIGDRNETV